MSKLKNPYIKLKGVLNWNDCEDINKLQRLCLEEDQTTLKLEIDYKFSRAEGKGRDIQRINEFMCYDEDTLIGYVGIGHFGGDALEVNGMVHPDYRRIGVFKRLFSLVRDEWEKRELPKMLLLSDHNSISGLGFIKYAGADYDFSEYEMYLRGNAKKASAQNNVVLRKADNNDAKEVARQNSAYFGMEPAEEDILMPEEEEKRGMVIYIAEVDNKTVGKVHLEIGGEPKGIYGLGVLPEYRGKGYGREILVRAIEKLKESDPKDIMLQVAVNNQNALGLYKSCGFEVTSTMDYYKLCKG